jgi:hypothetical protein
MRTSRIKEDRRTQSDLHGQTGLDPLQAVRDQAPTFNQAWLKNGWSLTLLQRIGFTVFSLSSTGIGLGLLDPAVLCLREGNMVFFLLFAVGSLFFGFFGVLGLINVLRFKHSES